MGKLTKITIVAVLVLAVCIVIILKQRMPPALVMQDDIHTKAMPRLVDLGAKKCIPCKMMAPILDELKSEYEGVFKVEFIDVWENPEAGREYGIRLIPTQIFYNSSGKELFRHEGFMSKDDILTRWKELGVKLEKTK